MELMGPMSPIDLMSLMGPISPMGLIFKNKGAS